MKERYNIAAPARAELDLLDADAVRQYLRCGAFDVIIHLASPTGQNPLDVKAEIFERSLRVFLALEHCAGSYGKMIYLGSGAEYGKHRNISMISEEAFGEELPKDPYGLSRYLMSKLAEKHDNIVNLRLFACCGPSDPPYKLIPHIINCIKEKKTIELHQDVWFDFLYVEDFLPVLMHFVEHPAKFKAYNLCSGNRTKISSIAEEICQQTGSSASIVFKKEGLNFEYTGSNARIRKELPHWEPRSISMSVKEILKKEMIK